MPEPIPFAQQTCDLKAPDSSPEVSELPVYREAGLILSWCRLRNPEVEELGRAGSIWLWIKCERLPPVPIQTNGPFAKLNGVK